MRHDPWTPPYLCYRGAASAFMPTTRLAGPVLVEDDRDVNLRKRGEIGTLGQISDCPPERRDRIPRPGGS